MNIKTRIGIFVGLASILFSTLCLLAMPAFTGAIIVAPFVGMILGAIAAALGARRTAAVTLVFAVVPACGFYVMEKFSDYFGTGYVAFFPLAVAVAVAAWVLISYSRTKPVGPGSPAVPALQSRP